ncbi:dnaJ homolog subfamily B member 9-like isoform 1-T2 [Symphorus nematophorus]
MAEQGVFHWMQVCCVVLLLCLSEALLPAAASETSRNYYETLNVEPTATDSQIKKNFRKLAIKYHPDKNKSTDAEKAFREIAEAYKVLSNQEQRRLYDSMGHEAFLNKDDAVDSEDEHDDSFHFSFADFFHDVDGSPFMEEPHFHWSFAQDGGSEDSPHHHQPFEEHGFRFYFVDGDEDEENDYF